MDIRFVRLNDGEDVIADMLEDKAKNKITLQNPMSLMFKRMSFGKSAFVLTPWLPVELLNDNCVQIGKENIVMTIEPKDSVKDYYLSLVEEVNELMIQGGEEVDRVLAQTDDEEEEEQEHDSVENLLETIKSKGRILH